MVLGLQVAIEKKIKVLDLFRDSTLVIYQLREEWQMRDSKLIRYHKYIFELLDVKDVPAHCLGIEEEVNEKPWYHDIMQYIKSHQYPEHTTKNDKRTIRRLATSFFLDKDILYKKGRD
ncbi:uncharacterized protein LOC111275426 [Durio zibethinus]|uniref:Uncharacterized protein LOC111275426 n=1 Tax=Durio zibethinus TaxID=66656 RepID=A0A6P5WKS1_DURZI|nr:uncharacterized protein LOC111275426 [Durio zibethinus]